MLNISFILFVAKRYFKEKRKTNRTASSLFSIVGITIGVMTLIVVMGVMNGFQANYIEPILNINSFHLQISGPSLAENLENIRCEIKKNPDVSAVIPFAEIQAILNGRVGCLIRAIPWDIEQVDPSFQDSFDRKDYEYPRSDNFATPNSIILGDYLARELGVLRGDSVSLFTRRGQSSEDLFVSGYFKTWYFTLDSSWAFVSLDTAKRVFKKDDYTLGIKLKNRDKDLETQLRLQKEFPQLKIVPWREYNKSLFSALFMEKMLMLIIIGLIFIVVGYNIFQSLKRFVYQKNEEIAVLKALGASPRNIRAIFIFEGFFISLLGISLGLGFGLFISNNISAFFKVIEWVSNTIFIPALEQLLSPFNEHLYIQPVELFSPRVFYINSIVSKVFFSDAFIISLFALVSTSGAAFFASRKISEIRPAGILRYE
ncbi:MAG: ABC transporter permease [Spirochaetales bacterium]|nr:ABC transporter permease [Spirochaetales bacterium]